MAAEAEERLGELETELHAQRAAFDAAQAEHAQEAAAMNGDVEAARESARDLQVRASVMVRCAHTVYWSTS